MSDAPGTSNGTSRKRDRKKSAEPPTSTRTISDERDYVDDKELMAAVQFAVLKESDDVASTVGDRNAILNMKFEEEVVNRVSALVWDTVVNDWSEDLVRFASHAGRQKANMDDVALLTRRNPDLFKMACELAKVVPKNGEELELAKKVKPRKRKSGNEVLKTQLSSPVKDSSRTQSPIFDVRPATPSNPTSRKMAKLENIETSTERPSFLATPISKPMTSTPKTTIRAKKDELFTNDITPIRSKMADEETVKHMTKIEEEDEPEIDSFDKIFDAPVASTSNTKENLTSLIRRAEEDPLPSDATLMKRMQEAELEAIAPQEEQYDSFDDDIIVETVIPRKEEEVTKERSRSFDPFASGNESSREAVVVTTSAKKSVFSKVSDFRFDDEDSFDAPIRNQPITKNQPTEFPVSDDVSKEKKHEEITKSLVEPKNVAEVVELDDDSFDMTVSKPTTEDSQKVPKWKAMKERWATLTPKNTPKSSKKSEKLSGSAKKNKSRLSMDYDSFDEFDFDI